MALISTSTSVKGLCPHPGKTQFSQAGWRTFRPGSGHSGVRNGGFLPAGLLWSLRGRAEHTEHKGAAGPGACFVCTRSSQSVLAGWKRAGGSDIYMSIRKPAPAAPPLHLASRTSVLFPLILGASSLWLPTSIWQTPSERFAIPLTVLSLNEYISNQPAGFPNGPGSHTGEMLALDQDGGHSIPKESWREGQRQNDFQGLDPGSVSH